jgi:Mn-containing catalase
VFLRIDQLQIELRYLPSRHPNAAAALQDLLPGAT